MKAYKMQLIAARVNYFHVKPASIWRVLEEGLLCSTNASKEKQLSFKMERRPASCNVQRKIQYEGRGGSGVKSVLR